jgi:hypothetical protein
MSRFTDVVEAEAREMERLRVDRDRWKKRAQKLKDERDEFCREMVLAQRRHGDLRQRVLAALEQSQETSPPS